MVLQESGYDISKVVRDLLRDVGWQGHNETLTCQARNIHIPCAHTLQGRRMAAFEPCPRAVRAEHVLVTSMVNSMTKCARCGIDIQKPMKEWNMQPRDGRGPALHVKHYACPQCGKKFRIADKLVGA